MCNKVWVYLLLAPVHSTETAEEEAFGPWTIVTGKKTRRLEFYKQKKIVEHVSWNQNSIISGSALDIVELSRAVSQYITPGQRNTRHQKQKEQRHCSVRSTLCNWTVLIAILIKLPWVNIFATEFHEIYLIFNKCKHYIESSSWRKLVPVKQMEYNH